LPDELPEPPPPTKTFVTHLETTLQMRHNPPSAPSPACGPFSDKMELHLPKTLRMKFGVIVFPGSNCDHDAFYAVSANLGQKAEFIWHDSQDLGGVDAVILPGGFAYGDYLRCGAIAKFSPVMQAVRRFAADGGMVLGVCNGFQILVEAGLLPGALIRNRSLKFICRDVHLRTETTNSPFTCAAFKGEILRLPIAHGEGCYFAEDRTLDELEAEDRVAFRYLDNPNGSLRDIAGILNPERNVMGMMPHPERSTEPLMGSTDGLVVFESMLRVGQASRPVLSPAVKR
jgi:phosphoribosylformylglycinamidine synthase